MDKIARRYALKTSPRLDPKLDVISAIDGRLGHYSVWLRYVPDKLILDPSSLAIYLKELSVLQWSGLEETALAILDDVNNEVVARWAQVTLFAKGGGDGGSYSVMVEDRQPKWDNKDLLSRLNLLQRRE